jgi:hypothetical protein
VNHTIDLQLGGSKETENLSSLDSSVNRSMGSQIQHQTKSLEPGTVVSDVTIGDK